MAENCCVCNEIIDVTSNSSKPFSADLEGMPKNIVGSGILNELCRCDNCLYVSFDNKVLDDFDVNLIHSSSYKLIFDNNTFSSSEKNFLAYGFLLENTFKYKKASSAYKKAAWLFSRRENFDYEKMYREKSVYLLLKHINSSDFKDKPDFSLLAEAVDSLRKLKKWDSAVSLANYALNKTNEIEIKDRLRLELKLCSLNVFDSIYLDEICRDDAESLKVATEEFLQNVLDREYIFNKPYGQMVDYVNDVKILEIFEGLDVVLKTPLLKHLDEKLFAKYIAEAYAYSTLNKVKVDIDGQLDEFMHENDIVSTTKSSLEEVFVEELSKEAISLENAVEKSVDSNDGNSTNDISALINETNANTDEMHYLSDNFCVDKMRTEEAEFVDECTQIAKAESCDAEEAEEKENCNADECVEKESFDTEEENGNKQNSSNIEENLVEIADLLNEDKADVEMFCGENVADETEYHLKVRELLESSMLNDDSDEDASQDDLKLISLVNYKLFGDDDEANKISENGNIDKLYGVNLAGDNDEIDDKAVPSKIYMEEEQNKLAGILNTLQNEAIEKSASEKVDDDIVVNSKTVSFLNVDKIDYNKATNSLDNANSTVFENNEVANFENSHKSGANNKLNDALIESENNKYTNDNGLEEESIVLRARDLKLVVELAALEGSISISDVMAILNCKRKMADAILSRLEIEGKLASVNSEIYRIV